MPFLQSTAFLGSAISALAYGSPVNITEPGKALWAPQASNTYQIVLSGAVSVASGRAVPDVDIFDIDLFDTPAETIRGLKALGKNVMCYFSAGTSEDWRPDSSKFYSGDKGACLPDWKGERWLNIRSDSVFSIMASRIQYAASLGCDAIDPDNMDGYSNQNGGGFSLTPTDSVNYLKKLAAEAAKYGMSTGLKNSQAIIPYVQDVVAFAVNEECGLGGNYGSCAPYQNFGKPVYHIEYVDSHYVSSAQRNQLCLTSNPVPGFVTIIKELNLDGWGMYCDGTQFTTPTVDTGRVKGQIEAC